MRIKIKLYELLEWLLVIFCVLNCHSVYNVTNVNFYFEQVVFFLAIVLFIVKIKRIHKYLFYSAIGYFFYQVPIVIYAFTISDYVIVYVIKYVFLFILIFLLCASDFCFIERIIKKFCSIVYFIAVISLFFYVGATVFKIIPSTGSIYLDWDPERMVSSFWGIYFEVSPGKMFDFKNSGIFAESPIYAAIICVALTFELFASEKKANYLHIVVFYITLLSTFSTTASIYIAISIFGIFWTNYEKFMNQKIYRVIFGGVAFIIGIVVCIIAYGLLMKKKNAIGISYIVRLDDYMVAFKALKSNFIFGVGFGNTTYSHGLMSNERIMTANLGQSSDFASLLASGGIYFMLIYVLGLLGLAIESKDKKSGIVLLGLLTYVFVVSRVGATVLFMTFICGGMCSFIKMKCNRKQLY